MTLPVVKARQESHELSLHLPNKNLIDSESP